MALNLSTSGTPSRVPQEFDLLRSAVGGFVQNAALAHVVPSTSVSARNPQIKVGLIAYGGSWTAAARVSVNLSSLDDLRSTNRTVQNIPDRNLISVSVGCL